MLHQKIDLCGGNKRNLNDQSRLILKKPLGQYFKDRVADYVDENLQDDASQPQFYAVAAEKINYRLQIACLDRQLMEARQDWKNEKKIFDERWSIATQIQKDISARLPEFNKYFDEVTAKAKRIAHETEKDIDCIRIKEKELRKGENEMEKLRALYNKSHKRLENFATFKRYLEVTVDQSADVGSIKELINRFDSLAETRDDLTRDSEEFRDAITYRQKTLDKEIRSKSNEVVLYRNLLTELLDFDTVLREKIFWLEDGLLRIKVTAAQRTLIIGEIKMAVHNLYTQICKGLRRHAAIKSNDILGQLHDVRISINEINRLSKDIKRMLRLAHMTAGAEAEARGRIQKIQEEQQKRKEKLDKQNEPDVLSNFGFASHKSQPKMDPMSKLFLLK